MQTEPMFVSGTGCDGAGAIVNVATGSQMNAIGLLTLTGNASFGGPTRWDLRNYPITLNDNVFTKTGTCEIAMVAANVIPGSGRIQIDQGLLRFEGSTFLYGSTNNTVTVNAGATLDLWDLYPYVPEWTMLLNDRGTFRVNGTSTATNRHVWGGPVTLSGTAFVQCNLNNGSGTIAGDISGSGKLVKNGSGSATLWLLGTNNTYSGGTIVSNGTLYAKYPGSLPGYDDGRLTVAAGATLAVHASDGAFGFTGDQVGALNAMSTFTADDAVLSIDTTNAPMQVLGDLTNRMGITKLGTNTLMLSGLSQYGTGNTRVNNGELVINGAGDHRLGAMYTAAATANLTITSAVPMCVNVTNKNWYLADTAGKFSAVRIGGKAALTSVLPPATVTTLPYFYVGKNGVCVLRLEDDASVTNRLIVGNDLTAAGAVYQSGNSVMHNWGGQATDGRIGVLGYGYYELNSGTFTNNGYFQVGVGLASVGILRQTGGAFQAGSVFNGQMGISRGGTGVVYTAGGTFNTSAQLNVGEISENSGGRGFAEFTVDGGTAQVNGNVQLADRTNMFATVNLNGGVLAANQIFKSSARTGSVATVNFDGGTFRARVAGELFGTGASALNAVNVFAGGAVIDTTNFNCAVSVPLRAPAGSGVVDIAVTPRGGYIGPPMVTIFGGGGTGATAIAQFDSNSGFVSGILMTCPGFGYTSDPTVMLSGGGTNVQTAIGAITRAANASGGLTKLGNGTLTLSAANTYTGATTVAAGTLKLGVTNALMPNTQIILAGGTLDLNGFTVTNMISGVGVVSNGVVETLISPAGAGVLGTNTLTFANATVKGSYLADVTSGGSCDRLNIQGNIDLSNLDLQIVDTNALNPDKVYTILKCSGTLTGTFKQPLNLPDRWHVTYGADGSVRLLYARGTLMWLR